MTIPVARILVLKERLKSEEDVVVKKALKELDRADMTFDLLKDTGIGVRVNKLRHHDNLGALARQLVTKWKQCAEAEGSDSDGSYGYCTPNSKKNHTPSKESTKRISNGVSPATKKLKFDDQSETPSKKKKNTTATMACSQNVDDEGKFTADCGSFEQILGLGDHGSPTKTPVKTQVKVVKKGRDNGDRKTNREDRSTAQYMDNQEQKSDSVSSSFSSVDWSKVLPQKLATDYRPQTSRPMLADFDDDIPRRGANGPDVNDLDFSEMKSKKLTKVYSGRRKGNAGALQHVPRLDESCVRVLRDNVEVLKYANVLPPFHLVTQILERATPYQLYEIEKWSPKLVEDTSDLWQAHCERDFKGVEPDWEEGESWRELYERMLAERDKKLNKLTQAIAEQKAAKESAVRQAKMAMAKAPREVRRRQMRYGTYNKEARLMDPEELVQARRQLDSNPGAKSKTRIFSHIYEDEQKQRDQPKNRKPTVAPLMAKSLKMMKKNRAR